MLRSSSTNVLRFSQSKRWKREPAKTLSKNTLQPCQGMRVLQEIRPDKRALQPSSVQREIVHRGLSAGYLAEASTQIQKLLVIFDVRYD